MKSNEKQLQKMEPLITRICANEKKKQKIKTTAKEFTMKCLKEMKKSKKRFNREWVLMNTNEKQNGTPSACCLNRFLPPSHEATA